MEFLYHIPTKLFFGDCVIQKQKDIFSKMGKKALIVTGKTSAKKNGSLFDVMQVLDETDISFTVFDQIEENPSLETIELGRQLGIKENVDFVIGIGGGSPLDAAKAISLFIKNPQIDVYSIFESPQLTYLPIVTIPTTAGTGSEVTPYSIVTVKKEQTKKNLGQKIYPAVAFLDYRYTEDLSYEITVNTAVDALTHLIEGYLNTNATPLSDLYAKEGFYYFLECFKALERKTLDSSIREKFLFVSLLAGMVITQTGTSLPHGMGYALTYHKGLPHGLANGVLLMEYLKSFQDKSRQNQMFCYMKMNSLEEFEQFLSPFLKVQIPIDQAEINTYTTTFYKNEQKRKNHPEEISFEKVKMIYEKSLLK